MDVGNDPFPRDEVTGLAAFENLEPVSALNVLADPEPAPQPSAAARTFTRPLGVSPVPAVQKRAPAIRPEEKTEILNLDRVEHLPENDDEQGWEEEATSILTPGALRTQVPEPEEAWHVDAARAAGEHAAPPAAALDMDWDEDEPPTRMRDELPFLPPIGGSPERQGSWGRRGDSVADADADPSFGDIPTTALGPDDLPSASLLVSGRPSPFPAATASGRAYLPPIAAPAADRGGAPSPFTATSAGAPTWDKPAATTRPPWMLALAGAVAALVLVLIGRALFGGGSSATVTLVTSPADANVFVDGKQATGPSSPYTLGDIAEGPHELVVQKDGFSEHRSVFNIAGDEARTLPSVELVSKKRDTGFAINSMPAGAEIVIDGAPVGKLTPAQVNGVTAGVHKVELRLAGHDSFELQVLVPENTILQLPMAELPASDKAAEDEPVARRRRSSSSTSDDGEHASSRREREPREAREPREPKEPREPAVAARHEAAPAAAAPSGGPTGILRLNSRPWSQVYVDNKLVGNTPQMGLPLSSGNHSIRLVNQQMGLSKTFSVSIKTGQMVTKVVNLVD